MIRLLALDVDGTLTDGAIYLDGKGNELKRFHVQDGMGLALLRKSGVKVALISGRFSPVTGERARELNIDIVHNGTEDKLNCLLSICSDLGIVQNEVAYAGDDINDLECIQWAGKGFAVANAVLQIREASDHVCSREGGSGAVREIAEIIMDLNGRE